MSLASSPALAGLPAHLAGCLWTAQVGGVAPPQAVVPTGQAALDAVLPGGGWPLGGLTELLVESDASCEWRLLAPALRQVAAAGRPVLLIGAPQEPHGLVPELAGRLLRVQVADARQALWATEQALRSGLPGAVVVWLPQAQLGALRRLQAQAALLTPGAGSLLFAVRPLAAGRDSSPAPLRLFVRPQALGEAGQAVEPGAPSDRTRAAGVQVQVLKRRGPLLEGDLSLVIWPPGLAPALAGRLGRPVFGMQPAPAPVPVPAPHAVARGASTAAAQG